MPVLVKLAIESILSLLVSLISTIMTKGVMKFVIIQLMDYLVDRYERAALKSESKEDDEMAAKVKAVYIKIKEEWK